MQQPRRSRHRLLTRSALALIVLFSLSLSVVSADSPRHGGTIVVTWQATLATIDPAYVYSITDWPQTHAINDGLLGFVPGTTTLTPHLAAAMPTESKDRRTFTFTLRKGLVFSNGDPITAQDFIFSWERELAPKTASPDTYFWFAVQGEADFAAGKAKHVSGFSAPDPYTIKVTLTSPYDPFLYVLATPCSMVVDPAVVHQYHAENKDLGTHVIGAGPFMLKDWVPGQKLDLVRNPHYQGPVPAYVDAVHEDLGVDASVGLLRIEKGQADLMGDSIPSAQFPTVATDSTLSKQLSHLTDVGVYMIALNTKLKPFNDPRVRQAIGYATSKVRAIRFINNRGTPATGILPSTLPGFANNNIPDPYPFDPTKAKQLLAQAGYANGFSTTMGVPSSEYEKRMAEAAIYDLKNIGINVTIKPVQTEGAANASLPMVAYHWIMDYPDPADFIDALTACSAAVPGGSNVAFYCNSKVDTMAAAARSMPIGPARVAAYNKIDTQVMADAAILPYFYDVTYEIHSTRIQNFSVDPLWYPFALEHYWLAS